MDVDPRDLDITENHKEKTSDKRVALLPIFIVEGVNALPKKFLPKSIYLENRKGHKRIFSQKNLIVKINVL